MKDMNFKIEVIEAMKAAHIEQGVPPDTLRMSKLKAMDLCKLTMDDVGPAFLDAVFIDGPVPSLTDWGIFGLKVEWLDDGDNSKDIEVFNKAKRTERLNSKSGGRTNKRKS